MEVKTAKLVLRHLAQTNNSTASELLDHTGQRLCYIIEDGYRKVKVMHETRIYAGTYEIVPRTDERSKFLQRYKAEYGHTFVPHLIGVHLFVWILIHIGNFINDTSGCLLANTRYVKVGNNFEGRGSEAAYLKLYAYLDGLFSEGYRVYIEIARDQVEKAPEPKTPEPVDTEATEQTPEKEPAITPTPPKGCYHRTAALAGIFLLLLAVFGFVVAHT